ncbi:hypothetical protein B9T33_01290 [Acinetobacter sp. ANC 5054]|uniref:hypothetical protein n=1 Tax=Acinetobacter sp. ANC 5054 TaxID=1977877 RepID=UPI000A3536E9|nr:hypothetical protein [Acinetobacter sp. ANC 5054]OTG84452.1 hypothetical protein B9T33_01290 [Acinetobacter sp. ANC 5054]
MHSKILGLGLISGLMSAAAFAEPPIQPGDTLESLSKVKIVTTVNGQPGSIEELVSSGQIKLAEGTGTEISATSNEQALDPAQVETAQIDPNAPAVEQPSAELAAAEAENALPAEQQNLAAAPQAPVTEPVEVQQESAAIAPVQDSSAAPIIASSAETPVNGDEQAAAALPETAQPQQDAFMAAPEAPNAGVADAPMQANPEAPNADEAIQAAPEAPVADDAIQAVPEASADATIN